MKHDFHAYRTSNAMDWDTMLSLVRRLYRGKNYRMSLLIGCGCFFGLRISDLLTLTWSMLLNDEKFTIYEKKTNKRRTIKINGGFQQHIRACHEALQIENDSEKCFISRKKVVYSTQRINVIFKEIKQKYNLKIDHISTHTMRKTFGLRVFNQAGTDAPMALMRLQTLFNHASPAITKRYLGITDAELESSYDLLDF